MKKCHKLVNKIKVAVLQKKMTKRDKVVKKRNDKKSQTS